jgi:hypothetical protein
MGGVSGPGVDHDVKARRIGHNLSADTHAFVSLISLRANRNTSFGRGPVPVLLGVGREGPRWWSYESSVVLFESQPY